MLPRVQSWLRGMKSSLVQLPGFIKVYIWGKAPGQGIIPLCLITQGGTSRLPTNLLLWLQEQQMTLIVFVPSLKGGREGLQ